MGTGRPRKEFDINVFENLCKIHCSQEAICAYFEIDHKTLDRRIKEQYGKPFSQVFAEKRKIGQIGLRQKQYELALKGNTTMLVWLGKNNLGQRDKHEFTGADGQPLIPTERTDIQMTLKNEKAIEALALLKESIGDNGGAKDESDE